MTTNATFENQALALVEGHDDQWTFEGSACRNYAHGLFQYPAMMVPAMQRELIELLAREVGAESLFDPFVGSGTTMTEAMLNGLDFAGDDINPMAVLLCRTKAGPFHIDSFETGLARMVEATSVDRGRAIEVSFDGWRKWFRYDVAIGLSRIRRAILAEPNRNTRRFAWVAMAETVRLCSNSRLSTVKLHARKQEEIERRTVDPLIVFNRTCARNLALFDEQRKELERRDFLSRGHYRGEVRIRCRDITGELWTRSKHRMLVTSPPYGDNKTTIPYGQHSFLPLQWIDLADIGEDINGDVLRNTHRLDTISVGGTLAGALAWQETLVAASPSLGTALRHLDNLPADRSKRVLAYCRDMHKALDPILARLDPGAVMSWTVGNRRVGGKSVPTDRILREFLESLGCEHVVDLKRALPKRRRMAPRNSIAETIGDETVLVMRKASA